MEKAQKFTVRNSQGMTLQADGSFSGLFQKSPVIFDSMESALSAIAGIRSDASDYLYVWGKSDGSVTFPADHTGRGRNR